MKKIFKSFLLVTTLLVPTILFNCAEEQLPVGGQLSLVRQHLQLQTTSASFGFNTNLSQTISVAGENTSWALTGLPEWISASATTGQGAATITLTAKENTSFDEARAAVLTFASTVGDYQYSKTISVSQPAAIIYITPSIGTLICLPKGETKNVSIDSNVDWTATSGESWLTVKKASNTELLLTATENLGQTRTATIHLMRTGTTTTITTISVTQTEAGVTGSTATIAFMADGEAKTTTFHAEASWTASVSDAAWLRVTPASGSDGDATLTITATANASANAHSGFVYVKIGIATKLAVPVSQEGVKFGVSASALTLKSTTESAILNVTANAAWQVVSKPDWVEVTLPETFVGTNALTLTPQDNPDTTPRTGQLVIGREGFSGNQTITLTQKGKTFGDITAQMDFPVTAATQSLTIDTDGAWTASTTASWIHLSPTSGQGGGQLQVSVDANPDKEERNGTITVSVGSAIQQVTVIQVGLYIKLSCEDLISKSTPSTVKLSVTSNMSWTASSNVDWLTLENKQGEGDATLIIDVADNPSVNARTGVITVQSGEVTQAFSFTQPGRTLTVSTTLLSFTSNGGTSETITVTTDGSYEVVTSDTWITINEVDNTFTVSVSENTSAERTATITVVLTNLVDGEHLSRTISVEQAKYVKPDPLGLCPDGNHPHVIDLGLSVKWACCNVGASSPIEYGDDFAWGETKVKNNYEWTTYSLCYSYQSMKKYNSTDKKKTLELSDDAAHVNWGEPYRMPTLSEFQKIKSQCTWKWMTIDNVNGYLVTSSNGNSIFLPAAGCALSTNLEAYAGNTGCYWTSTVVNAGEYIAARGLHFNSTEYELDYGYERREGQSVRPVISDFLDVSPTSLSLPCNASSAVFNVSTNQDYTISVSDSWITANTSADKKTVTVTATANTGTARTATITVSGGGLTRTVTVTQAKYVAPDPLGLCSDNNHPHVIDLGLSVKWACCNVGASSPIDYGGYYAWGETEEKTTYDWSTYKWCNTDRSFTKYCTKSSNGTVDNKTQLELSDDAARVKWGSPWRMPTFEECKALINCTSAWTNINGVLGRKFTGPNGASIFLPAAGNRWSGELDSEGDWGYYWSSTLDGSGPNGACGFGFDSGGTYRIDFDDRYGGQSVRPVR